MTFQGYDSYQAEIIIVDWKCLSFWITVQIWNYWSIILSCFCWFWIFLNCQLLVNIEKLYSVLFSSWRCQLASVLSSLRDAVLLPWAISFEFCFPHSSVTKKRPLNNTVLISFWVLFPHSHPLLPGPSGHCCKLITIPVIYQLYFNYHNWKKSMCLFLLFFSFNVSWVFTSDGHWYKGIVLKSQKGCLINQECLINHLCKVY